MRAPWRRSELADVWVDSVEPVDYVEFLNRSFGRVAEGAPNEWVWKEDADIGHGGKDFEVRGPRRSRRTPTPTPHRHTLARPGPEPHAQVRRVGPPPVEEADQAEQLRGSNKEQQAAAAAKIAATRKGQLTRRRTTRRERITRRKLTQTL